MNLYTGSQNYIKIIFKEPVFKDFKHIYMAINSNIRYNDSSHVTYMYKEKRDDLEYIFYGFFKDSFFVIICNSYNSQLDITIQLKNIVCIKLEKTERKIKQDNKLYVLDESKLNDLSTCAYILPLRQIFLKDANIQMDEYFKVYDYSIMPIQIKVVDTMIQHTYTLRSILKSIFF